MRCLFHSSRASLIAAQIDKLQERLFLGQHKLVFDGQSDAYTAYLKQPGYYTLGTDPANKLSANDPVTGRAPNSDEIKNAGIELYDPANGAAYQLWGTSGALDNAPFDKLDEIAYGYISQNQGLSIEASGSWGNEVSLAALEYALWKAIQNNLTVSDTRNTIIDAQMQERLQTQRLTGNFADIAAQEAGTLPVNYWNLEGFANPNNNYSSYVQSSKVGETFSLEYPEQEQGTSFINSDKNELASLMKAQNNVSASSVDQVYYKGQGHKSLFMGQGRAQQSSPLAWAVAYDHYYITSNAQTSPMLPLRSVETATTRIPFLSEKDIANGVNEYALTGSSKELSATIEFADPTDFPTQSTQETFWDYDQRVNVLQALKAVTINAAYSNKTDHVQGSIAENKYADFVILAGDPFKIDAKDIADIRVVTTIVNNEPVYGVLPGSTTFARAPVASITQKSEYFSGESSVTMGEVTQLSANDLSSAPALDEPAKSLAAYKFTASLDSSADIRIATFQMDALGNGMEISDIEMHKLVDTTTMLKYTYAAQDERFTDGHFWFTEADSPHTVIPATRILELNKMYMLHFSIEDNSDFDLEEEEGKIEDPMRVVSASGTLPTNSGTDDDEDIAVCSVGTKSMYDMTILLLAALGLVFVRSLRRKED